MRFSWFCTGSPVTFLERSPATPLILLEIIDAEGGDDGVVGSAKEAPDRHDIKAVVPSTRKLLFMASPFWAQRVDTDKRTFSTSSSEHAASQFRPGRLRSLIDHFDSGLVIEELLRARVAGFFGGLKDLLLHPDDFRDLVDDVDEALPL